MLADNPTSPKKTILWIKTGVGGLHRAWMFVTTEEMMEFVPAQDKWIQSLMQRRRGESTLCPELRKEDVWGFR